MEDEILKYIRYMFRLLGLLIMFPIVVHFIILQDAGTNQLMSLGYGELDAKLLMYYLVMFLTGFVGYCFGFFDGGKTPEEE